MAAALPVIAAVSAVAGTAATIVAATKKAPVVPPAITINDAQQQQNANDNLAGRQGSAADMLTGGNGAQPMMPGPKALLGN